MVSSLEKAEEDRISAYISLKHYHGGRHSPCSMLLDGHTRRGHRADGARLKCLVPSSCLRRQRSPSHWYGKQMLGIRWKHRALQSSPATGILGALWSWGSIIDKKILLRKKLQECKNASHSHLDQGYRQVIQSLVMSLFPESIHRRFGSHSSSRGGQAYISTARKQRPAVCPPGGLTLSMSIEHPGRGHSSAEAAPECMLCFTCFWSLAASQVGAVTGLPHLLAKYRTMALWGQVQVDSDLEAWTSVD